MIAGLGMNQSKTGLNIHHTLNPAAFIELALFDSRAGYEPEQNRAKYAPYPGPLLLC